MNVNKVCIREGHNETHYFVQLIFANNVFKEMRLFLSGNLYSLLSYIIG